VNAKISNTGKGALVYACRVLLLLRNTCDMPNGYYVKMWHHPQNWKYITHYNTHTHNHFSALDSLRDTPGELVPEETFTHSHLSWSSVIPYLLSSSVAIHGILPIQFTCLTVFFHNLCPSFLCYTSWPGTLNFIHFFAQSLSSFRSTCPYHCNLFCCSTEIMSSNPSLSLNPLLETLIPVA